MRELPHLIVLPVLMPLMAAALLLMLRDKQKRMKSLLNLSFSFAGVVVAALIVMHVEHEGISVYLAANWQAPFGIVLVADRLSALLLLLVAVLGACTALYAEAAWARAGVYFHPLFQIQLMGLNGAFLTGDLFNLFVFFEVMLAASYGLHLHGSGWPRVRSGLHYIAANLLASSLFLVGLAVLYGVVGTLTMADVAAKLMLVPPGDRGLLHAGATILAVAFLIKAAIWPLNAWLVPAYSSTSAPVAALFAVMTKVGIYALLRLWTLLFSPEAGTSFHFGAPVLLYGGLLTIAFGTLGLTATVRLGRIASFSIIVSAGTLLSAVAVGVASVTSAALFYMITATLSVSALFLLVELVERIHQGGERQLQTLSPMPDEDTNLDDEEEPLVGRTVPVSIAVLGLAFMTCSLLVAGLPPLSGFLAKFSLLAAISGLEGQAGRWGWYLFTLLLISGLAATISLSRAGIQHFWAPGGRFSPQLRRVEAVAVIALISACVLLTVYAEPVMRYTRATALALHAPSSYVQTVLSAPVHTEVP